MSYTYRRNGIEYCKLCALDLTKTRDMQLAHTCEQSDLAAQCFQYREMLEKMCNLSTDALIEARGLLGWETVP